MVRGLVVGGWVGVWIKGLEGFEPKGSLGAAFFWGIGDDGLSHRGPFGHKLSNELWSRLLLFFFFCRVGFRFRILEFAIVWILPVKLLYS